MRLCLVSQEFPPETAKGGIGTHNHTVAHGLAGLGHEVIVLSHSVDDQPHEKKEGALRVVRIPGCDVKFPFTTEPVRWLGYSVEVAAKVQELHSKTPLDIVVFPEWGGEGYIHLLNQTEWNRIPTAVHIHGSLSMFAEKMDWPEKDSEFYRVGTMMESTCLRLADAVSSSSRYSADWCTKHYHLKRDYTPVLHAGVDAEFFSPQNEKLDRPTVIFVGGISSNKGVPLLVEAMLQLAPRFAGLRLQLVGKGDARLIEDAKKKTAAAGFPDLIEFLGFIERKDLPLYLSRAHVFAGPSIFEGGPGYAYLEAMACELPVIASSGTGAAEVINDRETGFLTHPHDLNAFTGRIEELLSNAALRKTMGSKARQYVLREAEIKICLRRIEAFYTAVASGKPYAEIPCV